MPSSSRHDGLLLNNMTNTNMKTLFGLRILRPEKAVAGKLNHLVRNRQREPVRDQEKWWVAGRIFRIVLIRIAFRCPALSHTSRRSSRNIHRGSTIRFVTESTISKRSSETCEFPHAKPTNKSTNKKTKIEEKKDIHQRKMLTTQYTSYIATPAPIPPPRPSASRPIVP